ncbi:glutamate-cysteine ligase family protein [Azospirillum sp. ST 5-10]|uniref:glutamate-cysteine ligase family protein n=1 Tax=unclassified Azospirillum TaxID=2630922 RepID=UPI003F4A0137
MTAPPAMPMIGLEMEMAVADTATGRSHAVGPYFRALHALKRADDGQATLEAAGGRDIAVRTPGVVSSIDNGFNILESAIGPVPAAPDNLLELDRRVRRELDAVCAALDGENATVLNLAEHPCAAEDHAHYLRVRAPKPIYDYWAGTRGWDHAAGIDAKAQNSPSTSVSGADAVTALNTLLALSPAFIALFANSPFEGGRIAPHKENRLTLWPRMFGKAAYPGDRALHRLPPAPFRDLRDHLRWMFGPGTVMQCVPLTRQHAYKTLGDLYHIVDEPDLLRFLAAPRWRGRHIVSGAAAAVVPAMHHLEFLQFSSFLDARIRFRYRDGPFGVDEFQEAWHGPAPLEDLFEAKLDDCYIEGRAGGANFPDRELAALADDRIARSVVVAPSALQTGLLRNLGEAARLAGRLPWGAVPALRAAAVRDGLDGRTGDLGVERLCRQVVEVAGRGLAVDEQWMLSYPLHVLQSGLTGADRALRAYERLSGTAAERTLAVARERAIVWPLDARAGRAADGAFTLLDVVPPVEKAASC